MYCIPPQFNGKPRGILTLSVKFILLLNNHSVHAVHFQLSNSPEQNIILSRRRYITYSICACFKSTLHYLKSSTLSCILKNEDNKNIGKATVDNLTDIMCEKGILKKVPVVYMNNKIGNIDLHFKLQNLYDTLYEDDVDFLSIFRFPNNIVNAIDDYTSEDSSTTSSEYTTSQYSTKLSNGKDMTSEEKNEAILTLSRVSSAESFISATDKIDEPSLSVYDQVKNLSTKKKEDYPRNFKDVIRYDENTKSFNVKLQKKNDMNLRLSISLLNVYRSKTNILHNGEKTFIIQYFKKNEPLKSFEFFSKQINKNGVDFKESSLSMYFESCSAKRIILRAFVKIHNQKTLIGETKSMLEWSGFNTICFKTCFIKVPIWLNNKVTGHISLSYEFSKSLTFQNSNENNNFVVKSINLKNKHPKLSINDSMTSYLKKNKSNNQTENLKYKPLLADRSASKFCVESNNTNVQTDVEIFKNNKVKTSEMGIQVEIDDCCDILNKTIDYDVQNIFRCTHEITLSIEKKYDSFFNYVNYQFPESITDNMGKIILCNRTYRTFGNTNVLHLITLPSTLSLKKYFYKNCNKTSIKIKLFQNNDIIIGKVMILTAHIVEMSNEYENKYVTKDFFLHPKIFECREQYNNDVHITLHYKRVYHTLPNLENNIYNSNSTILPKNNSNIVYNNTILTSKDFKSLQEFSKFYKENRNLSDNYTQTNLLINSQHTQTEKCIAKHESTNEYPYTTVEKLTNSINSVIEIDYHNSDSIKLIQENSKHYTFQEDVLKFKVIISNAFNLPKIKLNGDNEEKLPTTYVTMKTISGRVLSTSHVVEDKNPKWNCTWIFYHSKESLKKENWLILQLWCTKLSQECYDQVVKNDKQIGLVYLDLSAFINSNSNNTKTNIEELYDIYDINSNKNTIGKMKVLINAIGDNNTKDNYHYTTNYCLENKGLSVYPLDIKDKMNNLENGLNNLTIYNSKNIEKNHDCLENFKESINNTKNNFKAISVSKIESRSVSSWTSSSDDNSCLLKISQVNSSQ
ncbi:MATH and LRR domain-containing protein PFE0570w-like [Daktulosphaira vitifoliae]|uniref:MATH and LRR domain-containing protein PFE0570w-like n=1 Tax=Daktulosphaira vitifoliae TaxID=58002 RepID=UPI0021AA869C|nr:MATH and LRR domain-containing protein PFE0570w-like [Daktulosphaira vitifoliae]